MPNVRRNRPVFAPACSVSDTIRAGRIGLACVALLLLAACSDRAVRDNARWMDRHACEDRPQSEYEDCIERARAADEEFDRARQEAEPGR